jgi:hypothetical protein
MFLHTLIERLKRRSRDDFKGRHYDAKLLIPQAVPYHQSIP